MSPTFEQEPSTPVIGVRYKSVNDFIQNVVGSFVRTSVMAPLCGYLIGKGLIDGEQATRFTSTVTTAIVGGAILIGTQGWSWWQKYIAAKREAALKLLPEHPTDADVRAKMLELGWRDFLMKAKRLRLDPETEARLQRLEILMLAVQKRLEELRPTPPQG